MIAWAIRLFAIWSAGLLLFYAFFGRDLMAPPDAAVPAAAPQSSAPVQTRATASNALTYRADKRGHVLLDGVVNGAPVRFIVDTGASMVALTMQDAMAAGISRGSLSFNQSVSTANGTVRAAVVRLREIRLDQFSVYDVPALVHEGLGISLLGQTFLKRLDSYEMREGVLTLYWN